MRMHLGARNWWGNLLNVQYLVFRDYYSVEAVQLMLARYDMS